MLWGGLRPILSRVVMDSLTLLGLGYAALTSPSKTENLMVLGSAYLLTLGSAGLTNRWTLTLPMLPFLFLQLLRQSSFVRKRRLGSGAITAFSSFLIITGAALSILFPAVELPPIEGPYNVGVVDFHMSVDFSSSAGRTTDGERTTCRAHSQLPVRLLYPTEEQPGSIPFLSPHTAKEFCHQVMKNSAPPPLRQYGWILHTWRLTSVRAKKNADLVPGTRRLPVVLFSHGLYGTAEIYSYQAMSLAAQGNVVLLLNHQDGSAPIVQLSDGTTIEYDTDIVTLWLEGKKVKYTQERRSRTDLRVQELVAATEALHKLDTQDSPELVQASGGRLSFRNRLATGETTFMGHSFGGATALTAASRRPDLVQSVIAHEPAVDWMPDDARRSLFPQDRVEGTMTEHLNFTKGFGIYEDKDYIHPKSNISLHDMDMLVLFSHEWYTRKWAGSHALEMMYANKRFGRNGGASAMGVVDKAHHNEFSDSSMLMPVWLARALGVTGQRNPCDTAKEIHERTRAFLDAVRRLDE